MLRKKLYGIAGFGFWLMLQAQGCAFAESLFDQGSRYYKAGDLDNAGRCFQSELKANPGNANAHYLMGNVYLNLHRPQEAAQEYRHALSLDPHGTVAQYSKQGLAAIETAHANADIGTARTQPSSAQSPPPDSESKAIQKSANTISNQTKETESNASAECEARIRDTTRDAERRIADLQNEMQAKIDANSEVRYIVVGRGNIKPYDPTKDNLLIKRDYQKQIDALKEEQSKKITALKLSNTARQGAAEDAALTLDREYVNRNRASNVKLAPSGTNVFVRSYETGGEASGNAVPVALPPAKKLPGIKSK